MTISKDSPDVSVIKDRVLSCGVRLLVEPNPSVKSAAVSWWVPAGTMNDPEGDDADGLAVLCAGMLERGAGAWCSSVVQGAYCSGVVLERGARAWCFWRGAVRRTLMLVQGAHCPSVVCNPSPEPQSPQACT